MIRPLILALTTLSLSSIAQTRDPLSSNRLYVPQGYDTNDVVELTITGTLPDTCHRVPIYQLERSADTLSITAEPLVVDLPEGCREMAIPFQKTITLGILPSGDYTVEFLNQKLPLTITEARGALQDDYLYGNVTNILEDTDSRILKLYGTNPIDCLEFDKLESEIQNSVIVLKPKFKELGVCKNKLENFEITYEVPYLENHPRGLLIHVRVMGGRSLSHLFQNKAKK
jgi:hypothetical protein